MDEKMRKGQNGGWTSKALDLLAFLLAAAAAAPFVLSARYALFHGDDFAFCVSPLAAPAENLAAASAERAWSAYTNWQGTFLTNILNPLLNPLNWYSFSLLRLMLIGCLLAAFAVTWLLGRELCRTLGMRDRAGLLLAAFLVPLAYSRAHMEAYLWHVGAMAYLVPVTVLGLGLLFLLRAQRKKTRGAMGASCALLFLAGGGVLLIGGLGACLTLLWFLTDWLEHRKPDRRLGMGFLAMLAGDLVNVLAPGNYVKAPGELTVFKSLAYAAKSVAYNTGFHLSHAFFGVSLLLMLTLGLKYGKRLRGESFALAIAGLLLTPVVVAFPYILGYDIESVDSIAVRAWFVIDIAQIFCGLAAAFLLGGRLRAAFPDRSGTAARIAAALAAVVFAVGLPGIGNCAPLRTAKNLRSGEVMAYAVAWREIYDMLRDRPGDYVVIASQPDPCAGVMKVSLGARPDHPMNYHMARYFGNAGIVDAWYADTYPDWAGDSAD